MSDSTIQESYALSPLQEGMLFHAVAGTESGVDVLQVVCRLDEELNVDLLLGAWRRVVERHLAFRTSFRLPTNGAPVQDVHAKVDLPAARHDWRSLSHDECEERWRELLQSDRRLGFDLFRPPLTRLTVTTFERGHHRILWTMHHAIIDGRAFPLILEELFANYDALREGRTLERSEPRPFRDYLAWLGGLDLEASDSYWRKTLRGFSAPTPLGIPRPVAEAAPSGLGVQEAHISEELTQRLEAFARATGISMGNLVQGAWALLLHRYSRERDIVFGSTRTLRREGLEGVSTMIGLLITTLPVRVAVDPAQLLSPWLRALREAQRQLRDHEHTPLVRVQRWSDVPPGTPLFDTIVVFDRTTLDGMMRQREGNWDGRSFDWVGQTNFPVTLLGWGEPALRLRLEYYRQVVDDEAASRMMGHLCTLLGAMPASGDRAVGVLPLLSDQEREQIVTEWNRTERPYRLDEPLHAIIEVQVDRDPQRVAVETEESKLTFVELDSRANQVAHRLSKLGVRPGTLVGIAMERSIEMVVGLLGILKAGGAYVPMDPTYPKERLAFMLEDANVPILLTQERLRSSLPQHRAHTLALDGSDARLDLESATRLDVPVTGQDLAYMIYTSGSTGRPKGAMNAHRGIVNRLLWMQDEYQLGSDDVVLQKTPFSFDVSVWEFFWPLLTGARLVMARPEGHKDPAYLVRTIAKHRVTTIHFVPPMLRAFLEDESLDLCTSLRRVICSGEALSADLRDRFFERLGCELHNLYGPTEAAVDVTYWHCRRDDREPTVPIGRPVSNTRIHVLDESLQAVPIGIAGELHIGGVQVGRGYLGRPELTAEKFIPDSFGVEPGARLYKTGDLARYRPDGAIEYLGRMDHQAKIRGFRIELGEIESVLCDQPSVHEATVVVRQDRPGEPELVAYWVPATADGESDVQALEARVRECLRTKLPEYMVPATYVVLPKLPLSPSGKVDRKALPAPDRDRRQSGSDYVAPRDELEAKIAGIWASVLGTEQVSIEDNFFDVGGNSLLVIQVVAQAHRQGLELAPLTLFSHPTVRALAEHLSGGKAASGFDKVHDRARRQQEARARQKALRKG